MPTDLNAISDPRFIVLAWGAGLALVAGYVSWVKLVGVGFTWLTAGTAALVSLAGAISNGSTWARAGLVGLVVAAVIARRRQASGALLFGAGLAVLVEAALVGGWLPAVTASAALGGVTGEMLLGHWYLIDPRLPRWALRTLALAGIVGLALDSLVLAVVGGFPGGGATVAFWVLQATSVLLMVGVIGALRYPAYSGVMAATGLSYLAVLTTLGGIFLGRALVAGLGPFS